MPKPTRALAILSLLFTLFLFFGVKPAEAALITVEVDGEWSWNVLSFTSDDTASQVEVRSVVNNPTDPNAKIALTRDQDQIMLTVNDNEMDISGYDKEIIQVEEQEAPKRVSITATAAGFAIEQRGITAETTFPITVNTPEKRLSVETSSGVHFLSVLPYDAVIQMLRTNILGTVNENGTIKIVEGENGEALYLVEGTQEIKVLSFLSIPVSVTAQISAVSGKVITIDQPLWYSILKPLLV